VGEHRWRDPVLSLIYVRNRFCSIVMIHNPVIVDPRIRPSAKLEDFWGTRRRPSGLRRTLRSSSRIQGSCEPFILRDGELGRLIVTSTMRSEVHGRTLKGGISRPSTIFSTFWTEIQSVSMVSIFPGISGQDYSKDPVGSFSCFRSDDP